MELTNHDAEMMTERMAWLDAGRPGPLEVCRAWWARPDGMPGPSWTALWIDSPWDPVRPGGCSSPLAEFTTWREAQDWAANEMATVARGMIRRELIGPQGTPYGEAQMALPLS